MEAMIRLPDTTQVAVPHTAPVALQLRSGTSDVIVGTTLGPYPCSIQFSPAFTEIPVVKLTAYSNGLAINNVLVSISEITTSHCNFTVWKEQTDIYCGAVPTTVHVQWFAMIHSDTAQDNCAPVVCSYLYPSSVTLVTPPATWALEAHITWCNNLSLSGAFSLESFYDFGYAAGVYAENLWTVGTGREGTAPYPGLYINYVSDPTHPDLGGFFAGAGMPGSIPVPGGGGQLFRVGDFRQWKGTSTPLPESTTGCGGLKDGLEHIVRMEYYGPDSFAFFIDGVSYSDPAIPITPAQLSTGAGYPGVETHTSWDNPVTPGFLPAPLGTRVLTAGNQVNSDGWKTSQTYADIVTWR